MSEPFLGEIRMFAGNFAPRGWAFADGQLLAVSQNDALFSLFGNIYGGDARTTFGLPDLRGRVPIHQGAGPGLSNRWLGSKAGTEYETVTVNELPAHSHDFYASSAESISSQPTGRTLADTVGYGGYAEVNTSDSPTPLNTSSIDNTGGSRSHTNLMPTLCINFIVALVGIYPSRH